MEKAFPDDTFLARWLNGSLTEEEKRALEARDDYEQLRRIVAGMDRLEAPAFSEEEAWRNFSERKEKTPSATPKQLPRWIYLAAASVAVLLMAYFLLWNEPLKHFETGYGEKLAIVLPDSSLVQLNARSDLSFTEKGWEASRVLILKGEAFFDVQPGKTFRVETSKGQVEVLGTRFNVYSRLEQFGVDCYSGKVKVVYMDTLTYLNAGARVSSTPDGGLRGERFLPPAAPIWTRGESRFSDRPLGEVIEELSRQYEVSIRYTGPLDKPLTVGFPHDNLEAALRLVSGAADATFAYEKDSTIVIRPK